MSTSAQDANEVTHAGDLESAHHLRIGARRLLAFAGFRRLLLSRFASQWSSGLFQTGLAGAVVFNPERQVSPTAIAAGFLVLLLPYSIIGPFAGALLDRWDRRRVLVAANLLQSVLIVAAAVCVAAGLGGLTLLMLALVVIGISRFIGAGLSAVAAARRADAQPRRGQRAVGHPRRGRLRARGRLRGRAAGDLRRGRRRVRRHHRLRGARRGGWPAGSRCGSPAARSARTHVDEPATALAAVANGLFDGARVAARTPNVAAGFCALLAHRASFGISLLMTVLLMRFSFTDFGPIKAGLPGLGVVLGAGALGIFAAGLTTARLVTGIGRKRTVLGALGLAAIAQLALGLPMIMPTALAAAFLISYAGQVIKLCVDAAVQRDIGDETRGRVFALYDMLFNITQVLAIGARRGAHPRQRRVGHADRHRDRPLPAGHGRLRARHSPGGPAAA